MQQFRPLRPREGAGSSTPLPPHQEVFPAHPRKTSVKIACQRCQRKKTKCNGARPCCQLCQSKDWECIYEVEEGLSRLEALRREKVTMRQNVESFQALYSYLQNTNSTEAHELLGHIREGHSLNSTLEFVKNRAALDRSHSMLFSASTSAPQIDPGLLLSRQIDGGKFNDTLLSAACSNLTSDAMRDGADCFFRYLGTMFPIFSREEVEDIIHTFETAAHPTLEVTTEQQREKGIACGELLAICAVGFQYDRQTLPKGDASICTPYYQKARLFLDYVVDKDPLRAMRMCCCLGMYNIIAKSTLAVCYTVDFGIVLASSAGLGSIKKPAHLSEEDHAKYTKVFRALITLRSWVTATLGHIPSREVTSYIYEARDKMNADHVSTNTATIDELQRNMARITILKADILRMATTFRTLSASTLSQMKSDLELWHAKLPTYLHLTTLVQDPTLCPDQRRVTFYMHLFYLSAIMLKARAVLTDEIAVENTPGDMVRQTAILDGVHAARSSARLLSLILDEGAVVKNCWLLIYQCYITYLLLIYTVVKTFRPGINSTLRDLDMALSNKCVAILEICATKDRIGCRFLERLRKVQAMLGEHMHTDVELPSEPDKCIENQYDESCLFASVAEAGPLDAIGGDVMEMLCYPLTNQKLDTRSAVPIPAIAESFCNAEYDLAYHLAKPFMEEREQPGSLLPQNDGFAELHGDLLDREGFIGGPEPHGWSPSAFTGDNQGPL